MKKTSLFEEHLSLNAKIVDFAGWQMPIQYKNLKEEVIAVRENIGVFDVSHMGEFFVEGPDAIAFVDHLVTNDIKGSQNLKAIYSPLCREDGTVIDDLIVYRITDTKIMICVNASNIEKDFDWISSQVGNFNINLTNKSEVYSLLAVQGPKSYEILSKLDLGAELKDIPYYSLQINNPDTSIPVIFARTGYTGEDGFEIFGSHEYIKSVWDQLIKTGVTPCGLGSRDVLRLEVCYPLYGHEITDQVTPLDSGLKWTVKFEKDNFIGKNQLLEYKPKYNLIKFNLDKGIPREGYKILDEELNPVGIVTSGTMSVALNQGIGLAHIEKNKYDRESNYFIEIRSKQLPINIVTKAFVTGGHK